MFCADARLSGEFTLTDDEMQGGEEGITSPMSLSADDFLGFSYLDIPNLEDLNREALSGKTPRRALSNNQ